MPQSREPHPRPPTQWDDEATLVMDDRHVAAFDAADTTTDVRARGDLGDADLDAHTDEVTTNVTPAPVPAAPAAEAVAPAATPAGPRLALVAVAAVALLGWTAVVFAAGFAAGWLLG